MNITDSINMVAVSLQAAAVPIIIILVNLSKRLGLKSSDAPYAAGAIGAALGIAVSFEMQGVSFMSALMGISAGITVGLASVGTHTISTKKEETGLID